MTPSTPGEPERPFACRDLARNHSPPEPQDAATLRSATWSRMPISARESEHHGVSQDTTAERFGACLVLDCEG